MKVWRKSALAGILALILLAGGVAHALTNDELLAQLQVLYQTLASLQAQIQAYSPAVPAFSANLSCVRLSSNLSSGSRDSGPGGPVSLLQTFLKGTGDYAYPEITGYFGSVTLFALQKYQVRNDIVSSGSPQTTGFGIAGPRTRASIEAVSCKAAPIAQNPTPLPLPSLGSCLVNGITIGNGASIRLYSTPNAPVGQLCADFIATRTCTNGILSGDEAHKYASCSSTQLKTCAVASSTMASGETRTFYNKSQVSSGDTCDAHAQARKCTDGVLSGSSLYSSASCAGPLSCTLDGATVSDSKSRDFFFLEHIPAGEMCSSYTLARSCINGVLGGDATYKYASCAPIPSSSCTMDNVVLTTGSSTIFYSSLAAPAGQTCASISQTRACTSGTLSGSASYNRASCSDNAGCTLDGTSISHGSSYTFYSAKSVAFGTTCSSVAQSRTCTNAALSGSTSYKYASCTVAPPSSCAQDSTITPTGSSRIFYKASTVPYGSSCTDQAQSRTCTSGVLSGDAAYRYASCTTSDSSRQSGECATGGNESVDCPR